MTVEYIALIIVAALAVLFIGSLVLWGSRKEPTGSSNVERTAKVRECYDQCRQTRTS